MGRRKIEIKAIKDDRNRSVTFLKRKGGLFKKAHELSVLCSVDVAVIIFGHNKKLYEFSSGDINETLGRYQYVRSQFGGAHEHKGPEDFMGKKDMDDEEEDDEGPPSIRDSHTPPDHPMMRHHLQAPAFQHINQHHAPSQSPPMHNGMGFRGPSPQPPTSRPGSRTHVRRTSSNLAPPHAQASGPPPQQSYAYMPNPPIYNPQAAAAAGMPVRPPSGPPPQHGVSYPPQYQQTYPPPNPHLQQAIAQEHRRQSMPASVPAQDQRQGPPQSQQRLQPPQPPPHRSPQPEQQNFQSPPMPQPKPLPSSARNSIFTPIDDKRSLLAQHWGEPSRHDPGAKPDGRSTSIDVSSINRDLSSAPPPRTSSITSVPTLNPSSRTNSLQTDLKRPRLRVEIPSEHSDSDPGSSASPKDPTTALRTPVRGPGESGVVLPPPSPSASALLSAGAAGPPNPFARPPPPNSTANNNNNNNNNNNGNPAAYRAGSDMETPISALPSRFVSDQLLPSPSSFYPEWGFGREPNMLPSPLAFPTPVGQGGGGFRGEEGEAERERKRKGEEGEAGDVKRTRT
ncbi:hypothetical protein P152DRAFT_508626 [Eremomyces bilateralis CBS 781.70]|uniref:MADS-box domain-containing protein n=1 Tax=Eremomyces bilateralis CBS 781.70 TaxID=1392243 RepID=A0A6G1FYB4_9PEZI|nr:uncharacterized protein P152DRAFT_508626 [Eremomyces bilateralis CBS 781.70]KAF1810681.1 hypothetical protein P152DRAFT_508626 [Eremomyces bilateralis CBS 781.70]